LSDISINLKFTRAGRSSRRAAWPQSGPWLGSFKRCASDLPTVQVCPIQPTSNRPLPVRSLLAHAQLHGVSGSGRRIARGSRHCGHGRRRPGIRPRIPGFLTHRAFLLRSYGCIGWQLAYRGRHKTERQETPTMAAGLTMRAEVVLWRIPNVNGPRKKTDGGRRVSHQQGGPGDAVHTRHVGRRPVVTKTRAAGLQFSSRVLTHRIAASASGVAPGRTLEPRAGINRGVDTRGHGARWICPEPRRAVPICARFQDGNRSHTQHKANNKYSEILTRRPRASRFR
jgi:hypothetical protein